MTKLDHTNASETSDEAEIVERLEKGSLAYISESGPVYNGPTWAESKAYEIIKRLTNLVKVLQDNQAEYVGTITKLECQVIDLTAERDDYKDAYDDTKRLARLIDVALCGEDGAAKQASLCDLVSVAKITRDRAEAAEKRIAELEADLQQAMQALGHVRNLAELMMHGDVSYLNAILDIISATLKGKQP